MSRKLDDSELDDSTQSGRRSRSLKLTWWRLMPVVLHALMLLWTIAIWNGFAQCRYPSSCSWVYGIGVLGATLLFLGAIAWHVWLVRVQRPILPYLLYGLGHGVALYVVWVFCFLVLGNAAEFWK
jgi:hypothetical protein